MRGSQVKGQDYNKRKKTEKVDDPSGAEHKKELDRGGGNFRGQENIYGQPSKMGGE